jgi:hypothetical protein
MMRRLLILLLATGMATYTTGCTGGGTKSEDGATDEQFAEEGNKDFADGATTTDASADKPAGGDDLSLDDSAGGSAASTDAKKDDLSLEDLPEGVSDTNAAAAAPKAEEPPPPATDKDLFAAETKPAPEPPPVEPAPLPVAEAAQAPAIEPPPVVPSSSEQVAGTDPVPEAPAAQPAVFAPLLKIKDAAFTAKDGTLLNRVYLGRKSDTVKNVAKKLYGSESKAKDLKNWNATLKSRNIKVGDKVYYASVKNPTDQAMLTYYEELGVAPQVYVTQKAGENLRDLSKEFLGNKDSWKEIWVTNKSLESKGKLSVGSELKYWPESVVAAAEAAASGSGAPPTNTETPAANANNAGLPESLPPAPDVAASTPPPPPPEPTAAPVAAAAPVVEPPPPPAPPPPKVAKETQKPTKLDPPSEFAGADDDSIMMAGLAGLLLLAGAITFVVIRRSRSKKMDLGQTQI